MNHINCYDYQYQWMNLLLLKLWHQFKELLKILHYIYSMKRMRAIQQQHTHDLTTKSMSERPNITVAIQVIPCVLDKTTEVTFHINYISWYIRNIVHEIVILMTSWQGNAYWPSMWGIHRLQWGVPQVSGEFPWQRPSHARLNFY